MDKLISTAKKLNTFFKIAEVVAMIAAISCLVGAVIVGVGLAFSLPYEYIGDGFNVLDMDFMSITVAEDFAPDIDTVLVHWLVITILASICAFIVKFGIKCIRGILAPMAEGQPFSSAVADNLKKLGIYSIVLGIAGNILIIVNNAFLVFGCNLPDILKSDKITALTFDFNLDLTFIVVAFVLFLLSYIFKYGEELQNQADETL